MIRCQIISHDDFNSAQNPHPAHLKKKYCRLFYLEDKVLKRWQSSNVKKITLDESKFENKQKFDISRSPLLCSTPPHLHMLHPSATPNPLKLPEHLLEEEDDQGGDHRED